MLARAGKRVLRPGGLGLTRAMLGRCSLGNKDVVELAPGLGRTAREIIAAAPRSYVGVDSDATAVARVNEVVKSVGGSCRQADAADTGLGDASADAVIGEAMSHHAKSAWQSRDRDRGGPDPTSRWPLRDP